MRISKFRDIAVRGRDLVLSEMVRRKFRPPPGTLTILTYHRIVPQNTRLSELIEPGMQVGPETFENHLQIIKDMFKPIRLRDWPQISRRLPDNRNRFAAVTFDDGWRDNFTHAFDSLKKFAVPATIFLVPEAVDQKLIFWSDKLAALYFNSQFREALASPASIWIDRLGMDANFFRREPNHERLAQLVAITKQVSDDEIHVELTRLAAQLGPSRNDQQMFNERQFLQWNEVEDMARSGLIEFGSHSLSHRRLDEVRDEDQVLSEIVESRNILRARLGKSYSEFFCYPNGNISQLAEEHVRDCYSGACTVTRGFNKPGGDPFRLRRIGLHQDSTCSDNSFLSKLIRD